ncbi:Copine-5 [Characodon lateralis]|uniref:Copine-5 n=1 Tax=Characodon lateralis TaxID=208331 RepID=A0ABU7E1I3_9TELE|nr:Copine-5 [Characodon lateralis]
MPTPPRHLSPRATPEWKSVLPLSRRLVPEPEPCIEVSPTISSRNLCTSHTNSGSFPTRKVTFHIPKANFCSRGSDRQSCRLRPPPIPHCTRPLWPLPRVVSPRFLIGLGSMGESRATRRLPVCPTSRPGSRVGPRYKINHQTPTWCNCFDHQDSATMQFCANKLDKKDFFGKSDPFMVFYRSNEDGTFTICHKTEVVKNTLNPVWQSFTIPVRALCNGDYDRTIKVEVYDWDRDGSHDFIGDFTTSYRELARGQSQFNVYEVINTKKKMKKKKYVNSGTVTLLSFSVESEFTFLDYIKGGTQINFTVAIDFTASNGE